MNSKNDISLPIACLFLILVLIALGVASNYKFLIDNWQTTVNIMLMSKNTLISLAISLTLNLIIILSFTERVFGYKKQGSRLRSLNRQNNESIKGLLKKGALAGITSCLIYLKIKEPILIDSSLLKNLLGETGYLRLVEFIYANIYFSCFILSYWVISLFTKLSTFLLYREGRLPFYKEEDNCLTLGSIGEDKKSEEKFIQPSWIKIPSKALNGNILVTGSIGTGKTQGTILTYTEQLFKRFSPTPTALVLDPKGSFIPEVEKMLKALNLEKNCISLGVGDETFNPVYIENPLKDSNYIEVASMIRSAARNFSGKSNEDPIWENSSFNLTKNIIVYCAAAKGYFTLNDCYKAILKAGSDEIIDDLKEILKSADFDDEETFNINSAIEYFHEYSQLEDKFKSSVSATSTTFLSQFQDYYASSIFCPPHEGLTINSMDEVVDKGKILLFNVKNEALARSMGTFVKLHYERSVLNRLKDSKRPKDNVAVLIADEYQDLASVSQGGTIGDDKICAKGREANFFFLAASQSINSIYNSIGNEKAAKELIQNFRTRIACHSSDIETIRSFKELVGQEEKEKVSHSISEQSQRAQRNYLLGGFDTNSANINESVSTTKHKEHIVTGKEFTELRSFEAFAQVYDGVESVFFKLFLKPYFLKDKRVPHKKVLKMLKGETNTLKNFLIKLGRFVKILSSSTAIFVFSGSLYAFPNICSVINAKEFNSCLSFRYNLTTCGSWPFVRPCYRFKYMVPQTFIEVTPKAGSSYFSKLPGASVQLASAKGLPPFGAENDEDTQSYHARTISVPLAQLPFNMLPCGGTRQPKLCFDGISEHIQEHWATGSSDKFQPKFLAWALSPKACLLKGAATSTTGNINSSSYSPDSPMCSVKLPPMPAFPPSSHPQCTGWGSFYPRYGSYNGPASLTGALMIAARMKSLSSEVFRSSPTSYGEKWQMISPGTSSCFKEGQNVGILDTVKHVREIGRLTSGKLNGHLFVVWKPVTCKRDIPYLAVTKAAIKSFKPICSGLGR